jgi:hypothetical protein
MSRRIRLTRHLEVDELERRYRPSIGWPLTNTALVNRHFAAIDDLEEAQLARCAALQRRPDLIRRSDAAYLVAQADQETTRPQENVAWVTSRAGMVCARRCINITGASLIPAAYPPGQDTP